MLRGLPPCPALAISIWSDTTLLTPLSSHPRHIWYMYVAIAMMCAVDNIIAFDVLQATSLSRIGVQFERRQMAYTCWSRVRTHVYIKASFLWLMWGETAKVELEQPGPMTEASVRDNVPHDTNTCVVYVVTTTVAVN